MTLLQRHHPMPDTYTIRTQPAQDKLEIHSAADFAFQAL
jgi:hypothetical protein